MAEPEPPNEPRRPAPLPPAGARPKQNIYRRRRILAGVAVAAVGVLLVGVIGVVYGLWKVAQLDRTDLDLPAAASGEPRNYLIVGSDSRAPVTDVPDGGAPVAGPVEGRRSDTIFVLRIDPDEQQAKMLSLPRDLWLPIAGTGERQRINTAFSEGEQTLVDTISDELDIPIHHFVEIDFNGFQGLVKAVGGVPLYFDRAMRDRDSGLDVLHPGCVSLDPQQALAFARSRHLEFMQDGEWRTDPTGDLGRISRQQVFIRSAIKRAVSKGLRNPLTLKRLVDVGIENVTVDDGLTNRDLLALGVRFSEFDAQTLQTYTIPADPDRTDGGADILRLREEEAEPVLALFRPEEKAGPPTTAKNGPAPLAEPVDVQVLNGSGIDGQAGQVSDWLESAGYSTTGTGNASQLGLETPVDETVVHFGPSAEDDAVVLVGRLVEGAETKPDPQLAVGALRLITGTDFEGVIGPDGKPMAASDDSTEAESDVDTSTTASEPAGSGGPVTTEVVGRVPGEPPPGESCG